MKITKFVLFLVLFLRMNLLSFNISVVLQNLYVHGIALLNIHNASIIFLALLMF